MKCTDQDFSDAAKAAEPEAEIVAASGEQAKGIFQVNVVITEMDKGRAADRRRCRKKRFRL